MYTYFHLKLRGNDCYLYQKKKRTENSENKITEAIIANMLKTVLLKQLSPPMHRGTLVSEIIKRRHKSTHVILSSPVHIKLLYLQMHEQSWLVNEGQTGKNCITVDSKESRDRLTNSVRNACLLRPSNAVNAASSTRERYATTLVKRNKAATINNDWTNVFFWLDICYLKLKRDRKEMIRLS